MIDCVSREAVNKLIDELARALSDERNHLPSRGRDIGIIIHDIWDLPSVTQARKKGKWEWNRRTGEYECSECGCNPIYEGMAPDESEIDKYRYCRWCGAKMEVD